MTQLTDDRMLTTSELATFLRTSPSAIYAMQHKGQAPRSVRVGKRRLWPESGVAEWLAARVKADS